MRNRNSIAVVALVIASFASRALFAAVGFSYNLFSDPFDPVKLIIDFGTLLALFALSLFVLVRALGSKNARD